MIHCSHFPQCGGCSDLDEVYSKQLLKKKDILRKLFIDLKINIPDVTPSPQPYFYRHKVQLPFGYDKKNGGLVLGCYIKDSHLVINQTECLIQDKDLTLITSGIRDWAKKAALTSYNEKTGRGFLRHVLLRKGAGTGEVLIGLVTNGDRIEGTRFLSKLLIENLEKHVGNTSIIAGIVQNVNTRKTNVVLGEKELCWWGRPFIKEVLGTLTFKVGLSTFFQVNPYQTPNLYNEVLKWIPPNASVLDLYSGTGSIALWVSTVAQNVVGIELNRESVIAAREATRINKIRNVRFIAGDTSEIIPDMTMNGFSVAVVDPPRKGLDSKILETLITSSLKRLIYVSCNPESLLRDINTLKGKFKVASLRGFDMFPHTEHIECVAVLEPR